MSTDTTHRSGREYARADARNVRDKSSCPSPILTNEELEKLRASRSGQSRGDSGSSRTLPMLFEVAAGGQAVWNRRWTNSAGRPARRLPRASTIIILSDRGATHACADPGIAGRRPGVHHHLIRQGTRTQVGFVIEVGEPREVHHFALLLGYGAAAVNPYLAFETLRRHDRREAVDGRRS